ncbi:MAG: hypothetical protein AB1646_25950 [Thermodesulfobacteriota bacterium]
MRFVILGYGKFGRLALERILEAIPDSAAIVVDSVLHPFDLQPEPTSSPALDEAVEQITRARTCEKPSIPVMGLHADPPRSTRSVPAADGISATQGWPAQVSPRVEFVRADAVEFLARDPALHDHDMVVPMVPFNVAARFLVAVNPGAAEIPLPPGIERGLPNPVLLKRETPSECEDPSRSASPSADAQTDVPRRQRDRRPSAEPTRLAREPHANRTEEMRSLGDASGVTVPEGRSVHDADTPASTLPLATEETGLTTDEKVLTTDEMASVSPPLMGGERGRVRSAATFNIGSTSRPVPVDACTLCCSRADFLCPDDCPEGDLCSVTGMPRDLPLSETLEAVRVPGYVTLVQRSGQILPGIGGYPLGELRALGLHCAAGRYLVATSCKCHGIVTAIRI